MNRHRLILVTFAAIAVGGPGSVLAQQNCGNGRDGGLQVDFNNPDGENGSLLRNINRNHLNEDVRSLRGGQTGPLPGDLEYALFNSPNHHDALYVTAEYHLRHERERTPAGGTRTMMCWFERAMAFAPTDAIVPMIFGIYLHRRGDLAEAERVYKRSIELEPGFAEAHYNLGLLYFDKKQLQDALTEAREAYRLGYPLPGLRQKLIYAGVWAESGSQTGQKPDGSTGQ